MGASASFAKLSRLRDVLISSPADGDILRYDSAAGKFKNSNGGFVTDIVIIPDGLGGSTASVLTPGITISGIATGDSATVFQNAINALAIQNGGTGGQIAFRGKHVWSSQVKLYPGIALVGQGPLGNKTVQDTGARIQSTYNGNTLVVTGVGAGNDYFPYLSNFTIYGDSGGTKTSQNLIFLDNSGGQSINDVFMSHVTVFNAGQHGLVLDATSTLTKLWIDNCYLEGCVGDGLHAGAGVLVSLTNCYVFGQTGYGIFTTGAGAPAIYAHRLSFSLNVAGAIDIAGFAQDCILTNCVFADNGSNSATNPQVMFDGNVPDLSIAHCVFRDDRGASAVQYHLRLARSGWCKGGAVTGNTFDASAQIQPIFANYHTENRLEIVGNPGYNDTFGKIASPFNTDHIGMEGSGAAAPTASTAYKATGTPLYIVSTAGTGVSITIADPKGNTVQSGLATFTGILPVGWTINFGAFSVAPTLYVGVT